MDEQNANEDEINYSVKVTNACKSYGTKTVFERLNLNVTSGSIYGLLGPSGCGKSTLLQSILGTIPLNSGHIDFDVESLKDIGYMPQDLCLEEILTVKETFEYFGSLYNMSKEDIWNKVEDLNRFLHFPEADSYIKNLSGGQCRRVSLGVCLLHGPKVIILDEPTVGVDHLLRQEIWNEFRKMAEEEQKTIIITTHYIEEAHRADCIGLMREGELVEEGSPEGILSKYDTDSLESAFLTICYNQNSRQIIHDEKDICETVTQPKKLSKLGGKIDFNRVKALLNKNCRVFRRDYWYLFSVFILPVIQTFNFCTSIGVDFKGLPIAIKSDEINLVDCQYSKVNGCIFDENNNQTQSCVVMDYLKRLEYTMVEVIDRNAGEMVMNETESIAFIYFPKNFTKDLTKYFDDSNNYDNESQAYMNFAKDNVLYKNQIIKDVSDAMEFAVQKTLNGCSNNPKAFDIPMEFITITGKEVKIYRHTLAAVFLGLSAFYFISVYSVSSMLSEKMDGLFSRSTYAGVTILELHISMFCVSTALILIQSCIQASIMYVFFSNPVELTNSLLMYALLTLFLGWIGFLFGLLIAGISPNKVGGAYMMNGWAILQYLLSGAVWPVEGQPPQLRMISELLPTRVATKAMNNIVLKGWSWNNPSVLMDTAITFSHVIVLVFVLIVLGKVKKDTWMLNK